MTKLLFIESSPRCEGSVSSSLAVRFLDVYKAGHPDDEVEHLNLFSCNLPPFGEEGANQKMENIFKLIQTGKGIEPSGQWAGVVREVERLKSADKVLVSAPMWNFSIPYKLKHYIDLICQPGLSFTVNRKAEYIGLVTGRPVQLVLTSGSQYPNRFPKFEDAPKTDFHRWYLEHVFRYIGFEDIRTIKVEGMDAQPDKAADILTEGMRQVEAAAKAF